jgi:hypothetical protein
VGHDGSEISCGIVEANIVRILSTSGRMWFSSLPSARANKMRACVHVPRARHKSRFRGIHPFPGERKKERNRNRLLIYRNERHRESLPPVVNNVVHLSQRVFFCFSARRWCQQTTARRRREKLSPFFLMKNLGKNARKYRRARYRITV